MDNRDKIVTIACLIILSAMLIACDRPPQANDYLVNQCERERLFLQCMDRLPLINMNNEDSVYECDRAALRQSTRYRWQFTQQQLDNCAMEL